MVERQTRKDEIMNAATKLFARLGFKKTTLDDVANEVGIVKSALYRYFSNKEDLFHAVIDRIATEHIEVAKQATQGGGRVDDKLFALLFSMFERGLYYVESTFMPPEVWRELRPLVDEQTAKHRSSAIDFIKQTIQEGVDTGTLECPDPDAVALMMHLFADNLYDRMLSRELDEKKGKQLLKLLIRTTMDGIRKRA